MSALFADGHWLRCCVALGLTSVAACGGEERQDITPLMNVPVAPVTEGAGAAGGAAPDVVPPSTPVANNAQMQPVAMPEQAAPATNPITPRAEQSTAKPDAGDAMTMTMTGPTPDAGRNPDTEPVANGDAIVRGEAPTDATGKGLGPFKVADYTSGFADQPGFSAGTIYYPTDAEPPFAYVVFCPGFVSYQTSIQDWGPFFASHGIVTMTIDTNTSSDSVQVRKAALMDAFKTLQLEDQRAHSPLKGALHKTRFGLAGWSMGGGASLLNASEHPELKSVVTLAEHLATSPGTVSPLSQLTVPTLMFAGTADTSILGGAMSQPAYEVIPERTSKMLYEVEGADHFFFNTPKALDGVIGRYGLAWQKVFLEGDERYRALLLDDGPQASDFRSNVR
jgi:dienelactone hydrolase